jgi:hypothetical protein
MNHVFVTYYVYKVVEYRVSQVTRFAINFEEMGYFGLSNVP